MHQLKELVVKAAKLASYTRESPDSDVRVLSRELTELIKQMAPDWLEEASSD